jgi:predicted ATPase/class 3 adenylate cyclase
MQICPGCGEENPDKFRVCGFCGTALAAAEPQPAEPETTVCPSCGEANPAKFRLCGFCGSPLAAGPAPSEERKVITAIFVDLVGSTARSENLDPEDVKSLVAPYHARVRGELEAHGGTFEKFSGDAILALFGTPKAHEDDPERAIRAALAVRQGIAELNEEDEWLDLHIRTGIHTGEALVMLGARPGEGEWSAAGDVLNTAARIQSAAPTDGILVSRTTYLATMDSFAFSAAEPIQAKGKAEPVEVWEVVGAQEEDGAVRRETEFVGREAELEELITFSNELLEERSAGLTAIVGAPGVGKSRLLLEFVRRLEEQFTVHRGKCLSYGEGITYWPIVEIFKSAAGILQSDDREASAQKLDTFLETLPTDDLDELRTIASALSNLIGIPTTPRGTYVTSEISQAELHWGIRRVLQLLASERPTAVVVEDLHWAEPTLLELLSYLLEEAGVPLAVIATTRPEIEDSAPGFLGRERRRHTVDLQTLGPEQAAALLSGLTGDAAFADTPFAETLITNAGGNPLFLEETVRMLREEGLLDLERWQSDEMSDVPIPTSVQGLISSRLDRLEPKEKQLAHHASVIGSIFWAGAVARLGAADDAASEDPGPGLSELERRDFVAHLKVSTVEHDEEYSFNHVLMRDVAYGQVPKGLRAQLHLGFTEWVKSLPSKADEFVEIVAWHLEQACLLAREVTRSPIEPPVREAAVMLEEAGGRAERRESLREAHRYYTRALDLLGDEHAELRVTLRVRRADMAMQLGELKEATDELLEVAEQASELGRAEAEAEALLLLGDIDLRQGRPNDAHRRLLRAEELAESTDDARLRIRVAFVMNTFVVDSLGEELDQPIENLRTAIAAAEAIGDHALAAEGHLRIAAPLLGHDFAAAEFELQRCLELADDLGSHRIEAEGAAMLGCVAYYRNRPEEAERLCLQARTWFERTGDSYFQVQNLVLNLATFAIGDGRAEEGEKWLREALPIALQIGGWVLVNTYWHLVRSLVAQDRLDDAREIAAFAARGVPEEDPHSRAWLSLIEAGVATAAREPAAAAAAFAEAVRLFEELNYPLDLADARFGFARSLLSFGEVVGGRTELERARSTYARIGADIRRDAVDAELAELAEGPAPTGPSTV